MKNQGNEKKSMVSFEQPMIISAVILPNMDDFVFI
jgi:hypothetical protein